MTYWHCFLLLGSDDILALLSTADMGIDDILVMLYTADMVDMTAERPVNEILAIRRYHVIYTIPYRHSVMRFIQV